MSATNTEPRPDEEEDTPAAPQLTEEQIREAGQLQKAVTEQSEVVRKLKEAKAPKEEIEAGVATLLELKARLNVLIPQVEKKKENKKAAKKKPVANEEKLNKLAQQNKKKAAEHTIEYTEKTPKGEKKDQTDAMLPQYYPKAVESAWYEWWEAKQFYHVDENEAEASGKKKFVIVIPPPNVTGSLHLGHALTNSVQDALVRWHRMKGEHALWIPGTDHAGIATQVVVEKKLHREEGKSRHDYGREAFIAKVWEWKEKYGNRITHQLRRLGSSLDWQREVFTMDAKLSVAVTEAFVQLFDKGLIYRSTRLVNWSCELRSAISDIEVEYETLDEPRALKVPGHKAPVEFGWITSFAYKVENPAANSIDEIVVATTRLETMLGDTAVAVHPRDPRWIPLHGKFVIHPFNGRRIPIITDDEKVDMTFGTGAVKITPAHDHNDYATGKKHNLEMINILNEDGTINANGGKFQGMKRFEVRALILAELKQMGHYRGQEPNRGMRLGLCSRSKDVIEPFAKPQWYVKSDGMAKAAADAARSGELKIVPEEHKDTWYRWLDNIQDWCISRQLWWGHRVPAYFASVKGRPAPEYEDVNYWIPARNVEEARKRAAAKFGAAEADIELRQDEDVLDTWFSSGLFPFSVFGWPNPSKELAQFYPTTLLETGLDILFFWVARMVMLGQTLTGHLPFEHVFLHAMVRDAQGRKMSKSLGNVIDPLDVIHGCSLEHLHETLRAGNLDKAEEELAMREQQAMFPHGIPECGADALRFALCNYTSQGRDINLDVNRVVGYRNFCNKLWNAVRFAMSTLGEGFVPVRDPETDAHRTLTDKWILACLTETATITNRAMEAYDFNEATTRIYNFWLYELCDYYVELIKPVVKGTDANAAAAARNVLYTCLDQGLKLLHPFMPFLTEELWQRLPRRAGDTTETISLAAYPTAVASWTDAPVVAAFNKAQEVIGAGRVLRSRYELTPKQKTKTYIISRNATVHAQLQGQAANVGVLIYAEDVTCILLTPETQLPRNCGVQIVNAEVDVYISLEGIVDNAKEIEKLTKQVAELEGKIEALSKRRAGEAYGKVPANVQQKDAENLEKWTAEVATAKTAIENFRAGAGAGAAASS